MRIDKIRLYTQTVNKLFFPPDNKYMLLYFSENSDFITDYPKLNLRKQDFRNAVIPNTRIPRSLLTPDLRKLYQLHNLIPFSSIQKVPERNFIFDISNYLKLIDDTYEPKHYRQRSGFLISNMLIKSFNMYDKQYKKILLYSVDRGKDFNKFINMKIFPVIEHLKNENIYFDDLLFCTINNDKISYRLLMKDGEYNLKRLITFIRATRPLVSEDEMEEDLEDKSSNIVSKSDEILKLEPESKSKLKDALTTLIQTDEELYDKIENEELSPEELKRTIIKSVLFKVSGDIDKAQKISRSIPKGKEDLALKKIKDLYIDQIIPSEKVSSLSDDLIVQLYDIINMTDGKNPSHIFNKRHIDFETNLKTDLTNSFKLLENKEIPIKLKSLEIVDKPIKKGELHKTDSSIVKVSMEDEFGNKHNIKIELPKIDPNSGTFRINGRRHCLLNQLILCPISFPKKYVSKFRSSYSSFHIWSKRTRHLKYLEIYMGSIKLPLSVVLSFSFGFDKTMKKYGINYNIVEKRPSKDDKYIRVSDKKYVIFNNIDSELKDELFQSFKQIKFTDVETSFEFPANEFFSDVIYHETGRTNSTYLIQTNLENIVDPISKQILVNMQLPNELENIMYYMATKVVEGFIQDRNDISNQRIRGSEVMVEFAQKQILAAYTEYKEQVLAGNEKAKLTIKEDKVLRDFRNSEVVADMEYANPIEEMTIMTRVSPSGKNIGGIPDKRAIQAKSLNVHNSYFGNIDPLDTPEGGTVGITQQLTIDSFISSTRGMFGLKEISDSETSGLLSTSSCLIPFIENNDGTRVIMAVNQSRQMLPLLNPEPPLIQSGFESILPNVLSDAYIKKAPCDGKITKVEHNYLEITCKDGKKQEIDLSPQPLRSGSGKNTLSVFDPKVKLNQNVKMKQVVAEGSGLKNGTISLGRNLLCAMMPYKGYNFEDGIVISEKLVKDNSLTSLHGVESEIEVNDKDKVLNIVEIGKQTSKGEILLKKTIGELDELLGYQESEDEDDYVLIGRDLTIKSPGGRVVDIEVFSNIEDSEEKFPLLKSLINKTNKKYGKPKKEKYTIRGVAISGILVVFKIEQQLPIQVGDKLANRFGNKGIICLIEKEENMPRTDEGEPVDVIFNPIGIIGRMNMGQLFELYTGLISKELAKQTIKLNNKTKFVQLLNKVLPFLDSTKQKEYSKKFISKINSLSDSKFKELIEQLKTDKGFPIIIPPFKAPKHSQIYNAMKQLGLKSGYNLTIPEYNMKTKNPVPIGYMYVSKLEHLGAEKLHARSTGPITGKVMQPTAGKRRAGGQRIGEGDTFSLISYNALYTLQEFFGPLSDDHITKNEIISDVVQFGQSDYKEPKENASKELINAYFTALILDR